MQEVLNLNFHFKNGGDGNDDIIVDNNTRIHYRPFLNSNGKILYDIGLICKIVNPFNNKFNIFIISGIRTYGVLGAAKCFTDNEKSGKNISFCFEKFGESSFSLLFKVPIINTTAICPDLSIEDNILAYYPIENFSMKKTNY